MLRRRPRFPSAALPAAALALLLPLQCAPPPPAETVIVVLLDTLRRDALGCFGGPEGATPNLDALAAESVTFRDAMSTSGWTLPATASLLTGTWPTLHGAMGKDATLTPIRPEIPVAAELFHAAGFRTTGIANAAFLSPLLGFGRGFDVYDQIHAYNSRIRRADASVDLAIDALRSHRDERHFLFLHLFDAHLDYDPPAPWGSVFTRGSALPARTLTATDCEELGARGGLKPHSPEARYIRGTYLGEVAFADRQVGRLVAGLKRAGLWERCTFVVAADHGEEMWEHAGFEHGHTLYGELVRIPLLIHAPGVRAGRVVGGQVRILDVLPTLCEIAGLAPPETFAGTSLLPRMRGEPGGDLPAFFEGTLYGDNRVAWSDGAWKLVWDLDDRDPAGALELFDLEQDPGELRNLVAERPDRTEELGGVLRAHMLDTATRAKSLSRPEPVSLAPADIEALRSLGYVR